MIEGEYFESLKSALIHEPEQEELSAKLRAAIHALITQKLAPIVHDGNPEVVRPPDPRRLRVEGKARHLSVATVPNEADPRYRDAVVAGIQSSELLADKPVLIITEAEAVALWRAEQLLASEGLNGDSLTLLVLDVGAATSDAALVEVTRKPRQPPRIQVLATGGVSAGGRRIDQACLQALGELSGHGRVTDADAVSPQEQERILRFMEQRKIQASRIANLDEVDVVNQFHTTTGELDLHTTLGALFRHRIVKYWTRVIASSPIAAVAGRYGKPLDVDHVILTGRAAQTTGLMEMVQTALARRCLSPPTVDLADEADLKSSVSLGARQYAIGLGNFQPSTRVFRDRLLYVWRDDEGLVQGIQLMAAWQDVSEEWHVVEREVPVSAEAVLVRSWLALPPAMDPSTEPSRLVPRFVEDDLVRLLTGQVAARWTIDAYEEVEFDHQTLHPRQTVDGESTALIRISVNAEQQVRVEAL